MKRFHKKHKVAEIQYKAVHRRTKQIGREFCETVSQKSEEKKPEACERSDKGRIAIDSIQTMFDPVIQFDGAYRGRVLWDE